MRRNRECFECFRCSSLNNFQMIHCKFLFIFLQKCNGYRIFFYRIYLSLCCTKRHLNRNRTCARSNIIDNRIRRKLQMRKRRIAHFPLGHRYFVTQKYFICHAGCKLWFRIRVFKQKNRKRSKLHFSKFEWGSCHNLFFRIRQIRSHIQHNLLPAVRT